MKSFENIPDWLKDAYFNDRIVNASMKQSEILVHDKERMLLHLCRNLLDAVIEIRAITIKDKLNASPITIIVQKHTEGIAEGRRLERERRMKKK